LLPFMNSNKTVPFISKTFTKGPSVTWFVIRAMKLSISPVWLRWNFCPQTFKQTEVVNALLSRNYHL
jgi:hypothetical protein